VIYVVETKPINLSGLNFCYGSLVCPKVKIVQYPVFNNVVVLPWKQGSKLSDIVNVKTIGMRLHNKTPNLAALIGESIVTFHKKIKKFYLHLELCLGNMIKILVK